MDQGGRHQQEIGQFFGRGPERGGEEAGALDDEADQDQGQDGDEGVGDGAHVALLTNHP